jgi:predicted lipoprotein with Yx(FWY)xxD motif
MNKQRSLTVTSLIVAVSLMAGCASTTDLSRIPVEISEFGQVSTPRQQTLYTYAKDVAGSGRSSCSDACARTWSPFLVGPQDAPSGDFSVIAREDGSQQWVYKGQPLYFFSGDAQEVDAYGSKGDEFWHVLRYPYISGHGA